MEACPPSATYLFRKYARRHKVVVAFILLLTFAIGNLTVSNFTIKRERDAKAAALTQATIESTKAQAISDLIQQMLASGSPDSGRGKDYTVRELLDQFSTSMENRMKDQPEEEATLRQVIGSVYTRLGLLKEAEPHLKRSLELNRQLFGEYHVKYADSLRHLAWNRYEAGKDAETDSLVRQALAVYRAENQPAGIMEAALAAPT